MKNPFKEIKRLQDENFLLKQKNDRLERVNAMLLAQKEEKK